MKGISILTGAVIALGLGGAPAAFANDDLEEVTMEMVFDEVDEIGGARLSLEEDELARDARGEEESDGDGGSDEVGRDRSEGDGFAEDERVAELTDDDFGVEHDDERGEGDLEDHDVEEEPEHDGELDGDLEGEEGLGEDEELGGDDVAAESDVESIDDVIEDDMPEEDDLV